MIPCEEKATTPTPPQMKLLLNDVWHINVLFTVAKFICRHGGRWSYTKPFFLDYSLIQIEVPCRWASWQCYELQDIKVGQGSLVLVFHNHSTAKKKKRKKRQMRTKLKSSNHTRKWAYRRNIINSSHHTASRFNPMTDWVVERTWGTIQWRFFSPSLFCERPLWAVPALFDVVDPAFPLATSGSPTLKEARKDVQKTEPLIGLDFVHATQKKKMKAWIVTGWDCGVERVCL